MAFDWRAENDETIEYHFNPRLSIENPMAILQEMPARAAAAREKLAARLDIRYGERPKETLDLFPATDTRLGSPPPAQIFIHGGYWRMMDKSDHSHYATDIVTAGVSHISLNYDLCPSVTLDEIVDEIRTAIVYIYNNAAELEVDPDRLFIAGHSAGGHLTGMMMRQDWAALGLPANVFKGAVPVSGVFDPAPVIHTSINADVRLDAAMAARNDSLAHPPKNIAPVLAVVGGDEPEGFHQLSRQYVETCEKAGLPAAYLSVPGTHHFTVIDEVFRAGSECNRRMMAQIIGG